MQTILRQRAAQHVGQPERVRLRGDRAFQRRVFRRRCGTRAVRTQLDAIAGRQHTFRLHQPVDQPLRMKRQESAGDAAGHFHGFVRGKAALRENVGQRLLRRLQHGIAQRRSVKHRVSIALDADQVLVARSLDGAKSRMEHGLIVQCFGKPQHGGLAVALGCAE